MSVAERLSVDKVLDGQIPSTSLASPMEFASDGTSTKRFDPAHRAVYQTARMSLPQLILSFMLSPGGWITLSVILSVGLRLSLAPVGLIDIVLFVAIVAAWPLLEWFFHRFLLHEWTVLPFHFTHDRHHKTPTSATGLPDAWIITFYFINSMVFWYFGMRWVSTLNVAVLTMLTVYEFVHFSCHCNYKPVTKWGWAIRVNHLQHHRFDESKFYSMLFPITK